MASVSPRHDTHPLIVASGRFSVSILAGDQVEQGQYFSYPGRKMRHVATEYLDDGGRPAAGSATAWPGSRARSRTASPAATTTTSSSPASPGWRPGRLGEAPLLYSSRLGWRAAGGRVREPGGAVRDRPLARVAEGEE